MPRCTGDAQVVYSRHRYIVKLILFNEINNVSNSIKILMPSQLKTPQYYSLSHNFVDIFSEKQSHQSE